MKTLSQRIALLMCYPIFNLAGEHITFCNPTTLFLC